MGRGEDFPGLFPLVHAYLDIMQADPYTVRLVNQYMDLIVARATGELPTTAAYLRSFVQNHPDYKQDSVVSEKIGAELVKHCEAISNGDIQVPELLGKYHIPKLFEEEQDKPPVPPGPAPSFHSNRLRGASFHEEIETDSRYLYRCSLVRSLVEKYKKNPAAKHNLAAKGFAETPAFLNFNDA